MTDRWYVCLGLAGLLIVAGTLATGLLPSTTPYQVLAGGIIVAGFAIGYACIGLEFDDDDAFDGRREGENAGDGDGG